MTSGSAEAITESFVSAGSESPCSFTADTLNLYSRPGNKPLALNVFSVAGVLPQAVHCPFSLSNLSICMIKKKDMN